MSAVCFSATLTAAGTPQKLSTPTAPTGPTISMGNVTYPAGSVSLRGKLYLQAAPGNTGAKIYVGMVGLNKTTLAGVGLVLDKGALGPVDFGEAGSSVSIDELYFDGDTTGDKVLVSVIG